MTRDPEDDELRDWRADWQADPEPAPEIRNSIRRRVRRKSLWMASSAAFEVALALWMLAFLAQSAFRLPTPINVCTMVCLALLILWATGWRLWYLRGTWKPSAETTTAFIDLSILRCQRGLKALHAGWLLLVLELTVMIPWVVLTLKAKGTAFGLMAILTAITSAFLIVAERRTRRELREWEEMRGSR